MKFSTIFYVILANIKIWYLKFLNKHKSIVPYKILLNLTDLCNSRCVYCEIWKIKPKNEINMNEIGKMFDSLNDSLIWLSLSGGEVTLVNYYYDLIDQAVAKCKNLKILAFTTNALSPGKALEYAKYAKDKGLDVLITISLDGDEATHDQLRGIKGNYQKCEKLFSALKKENINVTYGITVSDQNKNFIENKYAIYREKIRAVTFVHSEGIYKIKNELSDLALLNSTKVIYRNYLRKNILFHNSILFEPNDKPIEYDRLHYNNDKPSEKSSGQPFAVQSDELKKHTSKWRDNTKKELRRLGEEVVIRAQSDGQLKLIYDANAICKHALNYSAFTVVPFSADIKLKSRINLLHSLGVRKVYHLVNL